MIKLPDDLSMYDAFQREIEAKLLAGEGIGETPRAAKTRRTDDLLREVADELVDICGWSYWIWRRVQMIREEVLRADERQEKRGLK